MIILVTLILLCMTPGMMAAEIPVKAAMGHDILQAADPGRIHLEGFLGHRMDASREGRLVNLIQEDALLAGFRQRPGSHPWIGEHVGKWLHAAVLAWENHPEDNLLKEKIQRIAKGLMACQEEDGYLGTYSKPQQWSAFDTSKPSPEQGGWDVWVHKYVLIGLLNYYRAFGDEDALNACRRIGDLMIATFGEGKRDLLESGTHAGMAATSILEPMSLLYQLTGEKKYLKFCEYIVARADAGPGLISHIEATRTVQSVGNKKAYEMMSNYVGLVEEWRATNNPRYLSAAIKAWESIAEENEFITGGIDAHEHFSEPHTLISTGPCTETCVQLTWVQLNQQLLRATGDPRFAAALHRHIYNHMLAAQNPDGVRWCYFTTMEGAKQFTDEMHCCGSSGPRALALIPTFAYMTGPDLICINLYEKSSFETKMGGASVKITQDTEYPFQGDIHVTVETDKPVEFALKLLAPDFVESGSLKMEGKDVPGFTLKHATYASVSRPWSGKTSLELHFDMPLKAQEWQERTTLTRGPLVLAAVIDADGTRETTGIPDLSALSEAECQVTSGETAASVRGDTQTLSVSIKRNTLTHKAGDEKQAATIRYVPYAQAGVGGSRFSVWMPLLPEKEKN